MKKLFLYVFLVLLLTSCSEYMSRQKIENCADTEYSKQMAHPIQVYFYVTDKGHSNEFEVTMLIMKHAEVPIDMIADYIDDLLSEKEISEDRKKKDAEAIDTFKRYNYEVKKFINLSVDKKVNKKIGVISYRHFFETCELKQKEAPNTFNALWKKADIKYIDLSNLIKKLN
jgi:hypothetical protein